MKIREILLVENFARCLSNYTDYLEGSKYNTKVNHSSKVHDISENLSFQFLPLAIQQYLRNTSCS